MARPSVRPLGETYRSPLAGAGENNRTADARAEPVRGARPTPCYQAPRLGERCEALCEDSVALHRQVHFQRVRAEDDRRVTAGERGGARQRSTVQVCILRRPRRLPRALHLLDLICAMMR